MMQIYLDERQVNPEEVSCVGEAIAAAVTMAEDEGRMIIEVHVDGDLWTSEQLETPEKLKGEADEVRLVSAEPKHLVAETCADAIEALDRIEELQARAADRIQSEKAAEAMPILHEAFTLWIAVHQSVVQGASVTSVKLDTIIVKDRPAAEIVQELADRLRDLRDHLQRQDPLGLSDVLAYELPEVVESWRALLTALQKKVQEA